MDAAEIKRLWSEAGGQGAGASRVRANSDGGATGPGLLGSAVVEEPGALAGAALAVLGLPAGGWTGGPAAIRAASARYAGWMAPGADLARRLADYGDVAVDSGDLTATFVRAHERLADIVAAGATPLVLGGDAIVSLPVLQVLSGKLRGRLGIVAFSPGYDIAPEPLYAASSRWARALELGVVSPSNLVLIGGRAAPPDARAREVLDRLGVTRYGIDDVARDGVETVTQDAVEAAASGTEAVYLSVDMAVLEGAADPVGLTPRELIAGVAVGTKTLLTAVDICGTGPGMGGGDGPVGVAARVAAEIVSGVMRARA